MKRSIYILSGFAVFMILFASACGGAPATPVAPAATAVPPAQAPTVEVQAPTVEVQAPPWNLRRLPRHLPRPVRLHLPVQHLTFLRISQLNKQFV